MNVLERRAASHDDLRFLKDQVALLKPLGLVNRYRGQEMYLIVASSVDRYSGLP